MLITVQNKGTTYEAPDDTRTGDRVLCPPMPWMSGPYETTVSEAPAANPYDGPGVKHIVRNLGSPLDAAKKRVKYLEDEGRRVRHELKEARAEVAVLNNGH